MADTAGLAERTEFRTRTTKTFEAEPGRFVLQAGLQPCHYLEGGSLQEIAPTWVAATATRFNLEGAPFTAIALCNQTRFGYTYGHRATGRRVEIEIVSVGGVAWASQTKRIVPEIGDGKLGWMNILPDLDFYFVAHGRGLTLHKILRSDLAPREFVWTVKMDKSLNLNVGAAPKPGRENIDALVQRPTVDLKRELQEVNEVTALPDEGDFSVWQLKETWTGRAAAVDPETRIRSWTFDVAYPVRMF